MKRVLVLLVVILLTNCKSSQKLSDQEKKTVHSQLITYLKKKQNQQFYTLFNQTKFQVNHLYNKIPLLFDAVTNNNKNVVLFLLKKGADINYVSPYGTAMHWALEKRYIEIANILLNNGFDPKVEKYMLNNKEPLAVLSAFIIRKNKKEGLQLFEKLLLKGMNPNLQDRDGATAVHMSVYFGPIDLLKLLQKYKANINLKIKGTAKHIFITNEYTPLMLACYLSKLAEVETLLNDSNIDMTIKSKDGLTALDVAKNYGTKGIQRQIEIALKK